MRKTFCAKMLTMAAVCSLWTGTALATDYGDFRSVTLTVKAWEALSAEDYALAVQYADKCIELYAEKAAEMQASLTSLPVGEAEDIHKNYWALNDVATAHFIKGKALIGLDRLEEAKQTLTTLVDQYYYGQCYDPNGGWFWVPAQGARQQFGELLDG